MPAGQYGEGADSTFTHEGETYGVDAALARTRGRTPQRTLVSRLTWVLRYDSPDPMRVARAGDYEQAPLLIAQTQGKRLVVVDGLHRLAAAEADGAESVPTHELGVADLAAIRTGFSNTGGPETPARTSRGRHTTRTLEVPEMQRRNIPDWLLAVICVGCLLGILWLMWTAGG